MEYVLLALVLIEGAFIVYMLFELKSKKEIKVEKTMTPVEEELKRQENIDKSFQKLFNYNEDIATRGYKE